MQKTPFLNQSLVSRIVLALLLTLGVLLPLLMLFGLGRQIWMGLLYVAGTMAVLTLGAVKKRRWLALLIVAVWAAVQLFFPKMGFWGGSLEALKALTLFLNGLPAAMFIFGGETVALMAVVVTAFSFLFAKKGVGFLPAAIMVVLTMFGLWSLGESHLVWFVLPALVALLLLIAQTAHEKISVMNVLPMAVAVVLLSLLLLPLGRVVLPPLEKAAYDLKQSITDYLFFTEPRNVFTLGNYGYYPAGGNQLGGAVEPSELPVMMVKTERKTLMRAVAKDEYTGRSFRDTTSAKRYLYVNPRWMALRSKIFMEKLPPEALQKASALLDEKAISVQMQNTAASTVPTPLFLRSLSMPSHMVPYFNDASELFVTRDLAHGDSYTVFAPVFEGGMAGLDALVNAALKQDENYADIVKRYTQLPSHMETKVFNDAANIVAGAQTPYDQAMAIMAHLRKYYRYTTQPKTPPENNDFVTYFLYVGKEGYCTYFASAMTVLSRMAGLPARYVEGFLAQPAADGFAYVTGKEAHAWTEIYFEGFGWIPFDPTPLQQSQNQPPEPPPPDDQSMEDPTPSPPPDVPQDTPTPPPQQDLDNPTEDFDDNEDPPKPNLNFLWWLLAAALILGGLVWRAASRMPDKVAAKVTGEANKIFIYGNAVNTLLRIRGRQPKQGETPLLFAKRMDSVRFLPEAILPLWRMMALSNYSPRQPGKEQADKARNTFALVFKKQKLIPKLRFYFAAAFDKRCYTGLDTKLVHQAIVSKTRLPQPAVKGKLKKKGARVPAGQPASSMRREESKPAQTQQSKSRADRLKAAPKLAKTSKRKSQQKNRPKGPAPKPPKSSTKPK